MPIFFSSCRPHSIFKIEQLNALHLAPDCTSPSYQAQGTFILATHPNPPRVFSLLFRLQYANCGLRSPVRAIKTSWQGGYLLFICSFLMGQHKAGSLPRAPSGPSESTRAGGSNKQAGQLVRFSKDGLQSRPWPSAVGRMGLGQSHSEAVSSLF